MRALVIDNGLRLEKNYPMPSPPKGEALVRVLQAGVCNTDLELVKGYMNFTGVPGHEFVGVVERAAGREELIGQRVAGEINAACGACAGELAETALPIKRFRLKAFALIVLLG